MQAFQVLVVELVRFAQVELRVTEFGYLVIPNVPSLLPGTFVQLKCMAKITSGS